MASSPPPRSFSLFTWLAGWPPLRHGCAAADASRHEEHYEERILQETSKIPYAGSSEKHAEEDGESTEQDKRSSAESSSFLPCFILDSGASTHVVGDRSSLSEFTAVPAAGMGATATTYQARDGRRLTVGGVGTISYHGFQLSNVMHVPGLPAGVVLVSVQQLAGRGYVAMFVGGRCSVEDPTSGDIVGKGRLHDDGLYHLDFLNILPSANTTTNDVTTE